MLPRQPEISWHERPFPQCNIFDAMQQTIALSLVYGSIIKVVSMH
ncbi:hypothetical protein [Mesorhizobium sp. B4-1-4]|nr:hypothetical protein [Mesorhizobium sp. B4-1-4]